MIATTPYNAKLDPLAGFVQKGDYKQCKEWIDAGNPVLNPAAKGKSSLVEATANGFFSIVELLLDCGDWKAYPEELAAALQAAVETSHVSNVQILLDRGASPEAVSWYELFSTHNEEITRAFLRHGKAAGDLEESLFKLERGCMKAMAEFVPGRPDLQEPILKNMADTLDDAAMYAKWASSETGKTEFREECEKKASREGRHFWLLASTGVDVRRRFEDDDGETTSILEYTVKHGTLSHLRTLHPEETDYPVIAAAAKEMKLCDEGKMRFLLKCGFKLNDRADGTSSVMANALEHLQFGVFAVAAKAGGRLPELSVETWKMIRRWLYEDSFQPRILPLLAAQVSESRMAFLLGHEKCEAKFGRPAAEILRDLCHPETAMSPERFAALMKAETAARKGKKFRRAVQELRSLCRKAETETAVPRFGLRDGTEPEYRIRSVSCSKGIWPWLFNFLDDFVVACEELGGKCELTREAAGYPPGSTTEVKFCATFLTLRLPLYVSEPQISVPLYWSQKTPSGKVPGGCLEIAYERARQKYPLGKETDYLGFKGKAPEMAAKLFKLAQRKQAEEEREAKRKKEWEERWKHEEEERARREAERAERRKREEEEEAKREKVRQAERRRKEEDNLLFRRLVEKAVTVDRCRMARRFLDEIESKGVAEGSESAGRREDLARLRRLVDEREAAAWEWTE